MSSFIARDSELVEVQAALTRSRLVTLIGAPGSGKTRLALEVAARLEATVADGVLFVALADVQQPAGVVPAIARAGNRRLSARADEVTQLQRAFGSSDALLLIDNVEHVLDAAGELARLLEGCPNLRLLATSRVRLNVRGEQVIEVAPLALPDTAAVATVAAVHRSPAVRLFVARARETRPDFRLTDTNAETVRQICEHMDGLPLAIELAASQLRSQTAAELLDRLQRHVAQSLAGPRDLPARQQTLASAIAWSYDLLPAPAQRLYRCLGVFVGSWTRAAAVAVAADTHDLSGALPAVDVEQQLDLLVDHGLVQVQVQPVAATRRRADAPPPDLAVEPRFRFLETIRQFALDQLTASGERDATARRHADYYLALAEACEAARTPANYPETAARLELDYTNFCAAADWYQSQGARDEATIAPLELLLRLLNALERVWSLCGHWREGRWRLEHAFATAFGTLINVDVCAGRQQLTRNVGLATAVHARALLSLGRFEFYQDDYRTARPVLEASARLHEEHNLMWGFIASLERLGALARSEHRLDDARTVLEEASSLLQTFDDPYLLSLVRYELGSTVETSDPPRARHLHTLSLQGFRQIDDRLGSVLPLLQLTFLTRKSGHLEQAHELYAEGLDIRRTTGDLRSIAVGLYSIGSVVLDRGQTESAAEYLAESADLFRKIGRPGRLAWALVTLADAERRLGNDADAERHGAEGLDAARALGGVAFLPRTLSLLGRSALWRGDLPRALAWMCEGRTLAHALGDAWEIARAEYWLGRCFSARGELAAAADHYQASLAGWDRADECFALADWLPGVAAWASATKQLVAAAQLFSAADATLAARGGCFEPPDEPIWRRQIDGLAQQLGPELFAVARARGQAMSLADAIGLGRTVLNASAADTGLAATDGGKG